MALKLMVIFFSFILSNFVLAEELTPVALKAFKNKKYATVIQLYKKNPQNPSYRTDRKLLLVTASSFEKKDRYQEAGVLYMRIIKHEYAKPHQELLKSIKKQETIDGESFPTTIKMLYWKAFFSYGNQILTLKDEKSLEQKNFANFNTLRKILEGLEYKEGKVDALNDKVITHIKSLEDKVYRFSKSVFLDFISWQRTVDFTSASASNKLVITNKGLCLGGELNYENKHFRFFADGCFLAGSGEVQSQNSTPAYQQSRNDVVGSKISLGLGKIVSSSGAEVGFKVPVLVTPQELKEPPNDNPSCLGSCKIEQPPTLTVIISLYTRWHFKNFFIQTELGKFVNQDTTMWSLGTGYKF